MKNHWQCVTVFLLGVVPLSIDAGGHRHKKNKNANVFSDRAVRCADGELPKELLLSDLWDTYPTELCAVVSGYVKAPELFLDMSDAPAFRSREAFDRKLIELSKDGAEIQAIFLKNPDCFRLGNEAWGLFIDCLKGLPDLHCVRLQFSSCKSSKNMIPAAVVMLALAELSQVEQFIWTDVDCVRSTCPHQAFKSWRDLLNVLTEWKNLKALVVDGLRGCPNDIRAFANVFLSQVIYSMSNVHTLAFYRTVFNERTFASFKHQLESVTNQHLHTVVFDAASFDTPLFDWCFGDFDLYTTAQHGDFLPAANQRETYFVAQQHRIGTCEHCLDLAHTDAGWISDPLWSEISSVNQVSQSAQPSSLLNY